MMILARVSFSRLEGVGKKVGQKIQLTHTFLPSSLKLVLLLQWDSAITSSQNGIHFLVDISEDMSSCLPQPEFAVGSMVPLSCYNKLVSSYHMEDSRELSCNTKILIQRSQKQVERLLRGYPESGQYT